MNKDIGEILQRLLKYPPVEDIKTIMDLALESKQYIEQGKLKAKPPTLPSRKGGKKKSESKLKKGFSKIIGGFKRSKAPKSYSMKLHSQIQWQEKPSTDKALLKWCTATTSGVIERLSDKELVKSDRSVLEGVIHQLTELKLSIESYKFSK